MKNEKLEIIFFQVEKRGSHQTYSKHVQNVFHDYSKKKIRNVFHFFDFC